MARRRRRGAAPPAGTAGGSTVDLVTLRSFAYSEADTLGTGLRRPNYLSGDSDDTRATAETLGQTAETLGPTAETLGRQRRH